MIELSYRQNPGQNVFRLFHLSVQFPFTTSKSKVDYYHQKVNLVIASRVGKRPKTDEQAWEWWQFPNQPSKRQNSPVI